MDKKFGVGKKVVDLVLVLVLAACKSSGDSSSNSPSGDMPTFEVTSLLITDFGTGTHEAWTCIDQSGEAALFTFYRAGSVAGLEGLQLGMQYSLRNSEPEFRYAWGAIDNTSIVLQSPPVGLQDTWTNIEFSDVGISPRLMKVISSAKGQLYCSLQGEVS